MVLRSYRDQLSDGDSVILKAPQMTFSHKIRMGGDYIGNRDYLNADLFTHLFYEPAVELLGQKLGGILFEQEYQKKDERLPARQFAESLDAFFSSVPRDLRYHVELRTESYLSRPVFDVMERHGVGQVLSHWTWLPPLWKQFDKAGHRYFNAAGQSIIRLLTPIGTRYEDAYALAYPFDHLVEGMLQPHMVENTAKLMREGVNRGVQVNVIVNNRSGGNAPLIAQRIAQKFEQMGTGEAPP
jgi:uncharacterized protein YecE (DUF72 family)